jgi:Pectate lyase superfamily protein/Chaperone of endosialidase
MNRPRHQMSRVARSRRSLLWLTGGAAAAAAAAAADAAFNQPRARAEALASAGAPVNFQVTSYGADNTGATDATAAIQAAIDAARAANGGTVFFPGGTYVCQGQLNLDTSVAIRLEGVGGETAGAAPGAMLRYSGTGSSFISARSSAGFELLRLGVYYVNSAFNGILVDLSSAGQSDTALAQVSDCVFGPAGGPPTAAAIVSLDRAIISTVRNCNITGAQAGIVGKAASGHYSNAIQIRDCQFIGTAGPAIVNPGQSWLIEGCTFEARADGSAGAVSCGFPAHGLSVIACWAGDITSSSASTQIAFTGQGLLVEGNMLGGHPATTAIAITGSNNIGVDIRANHFDTHATAVDLGSSVSAVTVINNSFSSVATPVAGSVPHNGMIQNTNGLGIGIASPATQLHVNGPISIGGSSPGAGSSGNGQIMPGDASPVSMRQTFSTDGTGWEFRIAKNQKGQISDLVAIHDNGNVGIGVMNPAYRLQLDTDSAAKPGTATWTTPSDAALKDPASVSDFRDGLDVIRRIRPVRYRYNGKAGMPTDGQIGVIAQEIAPVMPYSIEHFSARLDPGDADETELLGFNPHALAYVLVNAVRELDARTRRLEADQPQDGAEPEPWSDAGCAIAPGVEQRHEAHSSVVNRREPA